MARPIDVENDVGDPLGLGGTSRTVASVYLPEPAGLEGRPVVAFGFPGAGYSRGYFSFDMPGSTHGGQAGYHVSNHKWIFVACDHLGVGESSLGGLSELTMEAVAAANQRTVEHVMALLREGSLTAEFPAIDDPFVVGIGQSMGGCLTIFLEGRRPTFDAVAVLGFSAIHTAIPAPVDGAPASESGSVDDLDPAAVVPALRYAFHFADVPQDIVDADLSDYPRRGMAIPEWGSATIPGCAMAMASPGVVADEASAIEVPVFVGAGEIDVMGDPRAEPAAYRGSPDITVCVIPRMAHMHNFASTRTRLWERLSAWASGASRVDLREGRQPVSRSSSP
jgi:pimeloyl-ACP methyl ester carboxylesterase